MNQMRIAILQRVIPPYRVELFRRLTGDGHDATVVLGTQSGEAKAVSSSDLSAIRHVILPTRVIKIFGRAFVVQRGLLKTLRDLRPDVIVCEAESHFIGYLTALYYKAFFNTQTKALLWCFFALP